MANQELSAKNHALFVQNLVFKSVYVIVQSREKYKMQTKSSRPFSHGTFLGLAIHEDREVQQEVRKMFDITSFLEGTPLCVEVSLETTENQILILETWCIRLTNPEVVKPSYRNYKLRSTTMLKSLISLSRIFPAHAQAQKQGPDSHIMKYRLYTTEPDYTFLGEGYKECDIGFINDLPGKFEIRLAYRTKLLLSPTSSLNQCLMTQENYFVDERKPCCHHATSGYDVFDSTASFNTFGSSLSQSPYLGYLAHSPPSDSLTLRRSSSETFGGANPTMANPKRIASATVLSGQPNGASPVPGSDSDSFVECDEDDPWIVHAIMDLTRQPNDVPNGQLSPTSGHEISKSALTDIPGGRIAREKTSGLHAAGDNGKGKNGVCKELEDGFVLMESNLSSFSSSDDSFDGFDNDTAKSFFVSLSKVPKLSAGMHQSVKSLDENALRKCSAQEDIKRHEETFTQMKEWMQGLGL